MTPSDNKEAEFDEDMVSLGPLRSVGRKLGIYPTGCLEGTRESLLKDITSWATDSKKPPIYWLNGLAGTGKSAIAMETVTVMGREHGNVTLVSFFGTRYSNGRNWIDPTVIFHELAVALARKISKFRSELVKVMKSNPDIIKRPLANQVDKLFVEPLQEAQTSGIQEIVIVIDALDLCKGGEHVSQIFPILEFIVKYVENVKFFVTSRPDPQIRGGFLRLFNQKLAMTYTLDLVRDDKDVESFLRDTLSNYGRGKPVDSAHLKYLCDRAGGLFIYAVKLREFIHSTSSCKVLKRVMQVLQELSENELLNWAFGGTTTLGAFYMSILQEAFNDPNQCHVLNASYIYGSVVLAPSPISPSTIASLLHIELDTVRGILELVEPFLILEGNDKPVKPFHPSLLNFFTDQTLCTNPGFCISPPIHHKHLLVACIQLMNNEPGARGHLPAGGAANPWTKGDEEALAYARMSWRKHLAGAPLTEDEITEHLDPLFFHAMKIQRII